jgi:hypothetical protein
MSKPQTDNLVVRQFERLACSLKAAMCVAPAHASAVALSPEVASASGTLALVLTDISKGGVGLRSPVYLPKGTQVDITLSDPALAGSPFANWTARTRVMRVIMSSRQPTFDLGTALIDATPTDQARLVELMAIVRARGASADGGVAA